MKALFLTFVILFGCLTIGQTATSTSITPREKSNLITGIDNLCKCTGLQRKSGLRLAEHYRLSDDEGYNVTLLMAADGVVGEYVFHFGMDGRYPVGFYQKNYTPDVAKGTGADTLKNESDRKFCLGVVKRLDSCKPRWDHYGRAMIQKDGRRGFRISFYSIPEREIKEAFKSFKFLSVMDPYINFSVTRKGTVYGIKEGG